MAVVRYLILILLLLGGCAGSQESALKDCASGYGVGESATIADAGCGVDDDEAIVKLSERDKIDKEITDIVSGKQKSGIAPDPLGKTLEGYYSQW